MSSLAKPFSKITDFSPLLLIPDLAAIIFDNKTGYTARTRDECGRSGKYVNSGWGDVCIHLCIRANVSGTGPGGRDWIGPIFTSVLRQVYCKHQENAVTGGCGDPGAGRARMRRGMRLGWGRVKKWKG